MSSDHPPRLHVPPVSERQWELLGGYMMDGLSWLGGLLTVTPDKPAVSIKAVSRDGRQVSESDLERTLKKSSKAREALKILLEEVQETRKSRGVRKRNSKTIPEKIPES